MQDLRKMEVPRVTYRLQLNEHFRLSDARKLVPYFRALGISHLYASPLSLASPHSSHGYDVCDFSRINPELGTEAELQALVTELHQHEMGLIVDIVPNHMGIEAPENRWWQDVLQHGRQSKYADYFDIDWESSDPALRGKVLLPVLGDAYQRVLERGDLRLQLGQRGFVLSYFDHAYPLSPDSSAGLPQSPKTVAAINSSEAALDGLIQKQNYRLAFWREGDARVNYRRFFSVTSLAGLRMEDPRVFADTHRLIRQWYEAGWIAGLRVDHPDGLRRPAEYLQRLRALAPDSWTVVEKILMPGEPLPAWPVAGTTGYDFLNQVNGLFIVRENEPVFTKIYADFTGETADYPALATEKKRAVLKSMFESEISRRVELLAAICPRRFSNEDIRQTVIELVACFPVYRTYIDPERGAVSESDVSCIERAVFAARQATGEVPNELIDLIRKALLEPQTEGAAVEFVARLQQLTGAAMAKGAEDTAFYCYNRFLALNEVGGDPGRFGVSVPEFHDFCARLARHWPATMLASSTHDTKRSEDVRARLNVLSEIPDSWEQAVRRWSNRTARYRHHDFPDRNTEYFFYQTLVGAWPIPRERVAVTMEKAVREAKQFTTWNDPVKSFEDALKHFVESAMNDVGFTADVAQFVAGILDFGRVNSLAQTLLKLTAPGVPDIYQGNELWDFSLVDPDNRRPVDFTSRRKLLARAKTLSAGEVWGRILTPPPGRAALLRRRDAGGQFDRALAANPQVCPTSRGDEGMPKLWLTLKVLGLRAEHSEAFGPNGRYEPLYARGDKSRHLVLFLRGGRFLSAVPRFPATLRGDWGDTRVELPAGTWRNALTDEDVPNHSVPAADLFRQFPVALLQREISPIKSRIGPLNPAGTHCGASEADRQVGPTGVHGEE